MKKITSTILGFSLALATAGISMAQTPAAPASNPAPATSTTTTGKKAVKKHNKKGTHTTTPSTSNAPAK
ncbi:MAG TPA: hypothetical protein VG273_10150 [Bryobacteraceae bacterium]|nr:hypothetical protein [Bryobacteraceae bacterium]